MGAGMPMDAIEKGEIVAWTSPFKPLSVAQLEVLCTALIQEGCTMRALDFNGRGIDREGVQVLAKALRANHSLALVGLLRCGLDDATVEMLLELQEAER